MRLSRATRDLVVLGAIGLPLYLLAVWYDTFDKFLALTNEPDSDAIDWLIILFVFLGIAAKIVSVRRTIDLHHEVKRRRTAEQAAHELARQDVLTGLPNRRWFIEEFDRWNCRSHGSEACALFVLDLDDFKPINDVYGHRVSDEVLRVVAKRLSRLAGGCAVARLGGDEFGIIMHYQRNSDAPERLARQIVHEIGKPILLASLSLESAPASVWPPRFPALPAIRPWPTETALPFTPRSAKPTWPCIGPKPRDEAATASSIGPWMKDCSNASSSRPKSKAPSLPVRSFLLPAPGRSQHFRDNRI